MKKIIFIFLATILVACAVKKPEKRGRFLKGFATQNNTLFNAQEALKTELKERSKNNKDNFYAPYINLLKAEEQPLGTDFGKQNLFTEKIPTPTEKKKRRVFDEENLPATQEKGASILEISEAKALKSIEKYSVLRNGEEKNKKIFDAYITLIQSRIYMGKYTQALDAINKEIKSQSGDKRIHLAKIYEGLIYSKQKDYERAINIFEKLKNQDLQINHQKLLSLYYAEALLKHNKKEAAVQELDHAFKINKNRELRSRISFLKGQILSKLGKNKEARESFELAYQYANDFEFEVKSQIEIAKTYTNKDDYSEGKKYLENIGKKGIYASRKNEFLYALGLMALQAGKKENALEYFHQSLKEKVSDPQIRGLSYYEIGKMNQRNEDYIKAGIYYDSALAVMTYEPIKLQISELNAQIKNIAKNYYLIKKNDSILALSKMSSEQQKEYFAKYINKLKAKEEAEERQKLKEEKIKAFENGDYNANSVFGTRNSVFQEAGGSGKSFYFANANTIAKGSNEFKQVWGNRASSDNWRYISTMASLNSSSNSANTQATAANPRRFEPEYYLEKIPKSTEILSQLKKDRDTATLGLGMMYDDYFQDTPLATKTLYKLVDDVPEEKVMLKTLYEIFARNYEKNPAAAERAKQILLKDYPYTSYAEFARNPRGGNFQKSSPEVENLYRTAFALYEAERFVECNTIIDNVLNEYKKDALIPKFTLLKAFVTGKTAGKEIMILQLEQIAHNYAKIPEGIKAKEMLNWLKSDLDVQFTDEKGNKVSNPTIPINSNEQNQNANPNQNPTPKFNNQNNNNIVPPQNPGFNSEFKEGENPLLPPTIPVKKKN